MCAFFGCLLEAGVFFVVVVFYIVGLREKHFDLCQVGEVSDGERRAT